jgi:serine protease AprX
LKILAVAGLVVLQPLVAQAAGRGASRGKLDRDLQAAADSGDSGVRRVIVQTRSDADRAALKKALQAHGDVVDADHPSLNALSVRLHAKDLAALALDPSVTVVSTDADVTVTGVAPRNYRTYRTPRGQNARAGLRETLGVDTLSLTGAGIGIAVIDSGIDPNADLIDNIRGFWDFTRNGIPTRAFDDYGHGTHVAGLIASSGSMSQGEFEGVAPSVRLFGFKVLDRNGRGKSSDVLRAIDFVIANRNTLGIDVINLSLGHPILESAATDPLVQAVERATRAGIVVVTAAGNVGLKRNGEVGYAGVLSPGNAPSALTVGAVNANGTAWHGDDRVASFSSRGPTWYDGFAKPDVVAPGVALVSDAPRSCALYTAYPQLTTSKGSNRFGVLSGTSMAAAVTTGAAALVIEAHRSAHPGSYLSPNALKAILQYSALPVDDPNGDDVEVLAQGTGEINVRGASELASALDLRWRNVRWSTYRLNPSTYIGGEVEQWSQAVVWGAKLISNPDLFSLRSALLDENIVWGTLALNGENIVWGTLANVENVVWGTDAAWAANLVWGNAALGLTLGNGNVVWGSSRLSDAENIVWGTLNGENIVWGTLSDAENIVWGTMRGDDGENIVWGTALQLLGKGSF